MKVIFLGHAQLLIESAGRHLLLDPWFAEPVFARAWWHYPPRPYPTPASLPGLDALVLSHIHPDHSGPDTLALLDPGTPSFAMPFASGALRRRLERAGYRRVSWLPGFETREVLPGVSLTLVPHDGGWEVASAVIEAEGVRIYHGNDNVLSVTAYAEIARRLGPIDLAFLPFSGASSYPTCFAWEPGTLEEKAREKKLGGIARFTDGISGLRPRLAVPFASSFALLEPEELWKNYLDRPTPDEACAASREAAAAAGTSVLRMDPGDAWDPAGGHRPRGLTADHGYDREGVERYARAIADRVAAAGAGRVAGGPRGDPGLLDGAVRRYFETMLAQTAASTKQLRMLAGLVAEGKGGGAWHLVFEPGRAPEVRSGPSADADETLTVTAGEMWDIVAGPLNWEDPWYGYRLRVRKRLGAGYYRAFWEMLLNFDDEALSQAIAAALPAASR
jgi:L-ascorbate metabolism protein UlaG (beta-lactamase superfamily)